MWTSNAAPYARDLLEQLIQAADAYAMTMGALLLKERDYELNPRGDLVLLPAGVQKACEARRIEALRLHADLVADAQAPAFDESPRFDRLDTFAQRKDLVHRKEAEIRRARKKKPDVSEWWKPSPLPLYPIKNHWTGQPRAPGCSTGSSIA